MAFSGPPGLLPHFRLIFALCATTTRQKYLPRQFSDSAQRDLMRHKATCSASIRIPVYGYGHDMPFFSLIGGCLDLARDS